MKDYSHSSYCRLTSKERTAKYKEHDDHTASVLSVNSKVLKLNTISELMFRAILHHKTFVGPIVGLATMSLKSCSPVECETESDTQTLFTKVSTLLKPIVQFPHGESF